VKQQLLAMIENSFRENEAAIEQSMRMQGKITPAGFNDVYLKLDAILADLERLETGLNSPEYKKYITETIHTEFDYKLTSLHEYIVSAKNSFHASDAELKLDEGRLNCINNDLKLLYSVGEGRRPTAGPGGPGGASRQGSIMHENRDILR
jgi:hypothetical protein